jgi:uncharacterized protein
MNLVLGLGALVGAVFSAARMGRVGLQTGRFVGPWPTATLLALIGAIAGFMTGLLGVGGSFVIVPMLRRFMSVATPGIVGTSLMVVALVGLGDVASAFLRGAVLPMPITAAFTAALVGGMWVGVGALATCRHDRWSWASRSSWPSLPLGSW